MSLTIRSLLLAFCFFVGSSSAFGDAPGTSPDYDYVWWCQAMGRYQSHYVFVNGNSKDNETSAQLDALRTCKALYTNCEIRSCTRKFN